MLAIFLAALLFGFAFNVSPGAVFSETLRRGLTGGFRPALLVQLGSLIGDAVWALLGLTGLALLLGYEQVRIPLTLACAAYLAWLGVQGLRDAWSPPLAAEDAGEQGRNAFGAGAAISLSNPKNVVYWGALGSALMHFGRNAKESMKQFVIPHSMIFEQLGIVCTTPVDGHNIHELKEMLSTCLAADGPVLMHVVTKKGAGYGPAMAEPTRFHGTGPYDIATGKAIKKPAKAPSYTSVFGEALLNEARADERIVAITAAMESGTGLTDFEKEFPNRFIDVGICEENAAGMAAGLAIGGRKPVFAVYSTFLQRAIDQLIVNNALMNLDVVFAIDRAGLVGADGPTHHGMFDLVYTRMVPNMRVLAPSNEAELVNSLHTALVLGGPFAVRYPRGEACGVPVPDKPETYEPGVSRLVKDGSDIAILAFGNMVSPALEAACALEGEGLSVRVVDMRWVKPLDTEAIRRAAETRLVVTVEDGVVEGGVGEEVLAELARQDAKAPVLTLGIPDRYIMQGAPDFLMHELGLDAEGIAAAIEEKLEAL